LSHILNQEIAIPKPYEPKIGSSFGGIFALSQVFVVSKPQTTKTETEINLGKGKS